MTKQRKKNKKKQTCIKSQNGISVDEIREMLYENLDFNNPSHIDSFYEVTKRDKMFSSCKLFDFNYLRFISYLKNEKRFTYTSSDEVSNDSYFFEMYERPEFEINVAKYIMKKSPFFKTASDMGFIFPFNGTYLDQPHNKKYLKDIEKRSFFARFQNSSKKIMLEKDIVVNTIPKLYEHYFESLLLDQRNKSNHIYNDEDFHGTSLKETENIINSPYRKRTFYNTLYLSSHFFTTQDFDFLERYVDKNENILNEYIMSHFLKELAMCMLNPNNKLFSRYQQEFKDFYNKNQALLDSRFNEIDWSYNPIQSLVSSIDNYKITISILLSNDEDSVHKFLKKCLVFNEKSIDDIDIKYAKINNKKLNVIDKISYLVSRMSKIDNTEEFNSIKECKYSYDLAIETHKKELVQNALSSNMIKSNQNDKIKDLLDYDKLSKISGINNPYLQTSIRVQALIELYYLFSKDFENAYDMNLSVFIVQMIKDNLDPITYSQTLYLMYLSYVSNKEYEICLNLEFYQDEDKNSIQDVCYRKKYSDFNKKINSYDDLSKDENIKKLVCYDFSNKDEIKEYLKNQINNDSFYKHALLHNTIKNKYNDNIRIHMKEYLISIMNVMAQAMHNNDEDDDYTKERKIIDVTNTSDLCKMFDYDDVIKAFNQSSFYDLLDISQNISDSNNISNVYYQLCNGDKDYGFMVFIKTLFSMNGYNLDLMTSMKNNLNMKSLTIAFDQMMKEYETSDTNIFMDSYNIVLCFGFIILNLLENDKFANKVKKSSSDYTYEAQIDNLNQLIHTKDDLITSLNCQNNELKEKLQASYTSSKKDMEAIRSTERKEVEKQYHNKMSDLEKKILELEEQNKLLKKSNGTLKKNIYEMQRYIEKEDNDIEIDLDDNLNNSFKDKVIELSKKYHISWIGGHENLKKKIITTFPDIHVCKENINSSDYSYTANADFVIFLTQHMSHSEYTKIQNLCFSNDIPFFYIKGQNLEILSEQIIDNIENLQ